MIYKEKINFLAKFEYDKNLIENKFYETNKATEAAFILFVNLD